MVPTAAPNQSLGTLNGMLSLMGLNGVNGVNGGNGCEIGVNIGFFLELYVAVGGIRMCVCL